MNIIQKGIAIMKMSFFQKKYYRGKQKKYYLGNQSKYLPKQYLHFQMVPHEGSLWSAIKWWLFNKNKHCHSFCPTCEYYYRCQEDVAMEREFGIESPALKTNQLPPWRIGNKFRRR